MLFIEKVCAEEDEVEDVVFVAVVDAVEAVELALPVVAVSSFLLQDILINSRKKKL
jgi:hypothetical protein